MEMFLISFLHNNEAHVAQGCKFRWPKRQKYTIFHHLNPSGEIVNPIIKNCIPHVKVVFEGSQAIKRRV